MTPERVSLVLPSRGRPNSLTELVESAAALADAPDLLDVCVRVDFDDPSLDGYWPVARATGAKILAGPRLRGGYSGLWDEAAELADGDLLLLTGDDMRVRTPGWDSLVRAEFNKIPDRIAVVYGRDGIADERMATHPIIHRRWVEATGRICPAIYAGDYVDLHVHEIAAALGRLRYLPDLFTEHLHCSNGKAPMDATYQDKIDRMAEQRTFEVWEASADRRAADASKLLAVMAP